ncbi:MAG: alpha/beta fold hydrolase, partial [Gammaproteobacteria bacterium]
MSAKIRSAALQFRPPRGLRDAHIQSIMGSSSLRGWALRLSAHDFVKRSSATVLHCGAGVRLLAKINIPPEPAEAVVVLLHGWEGNADATYMVSLGHRLLQRRCITVRINFRDHGGTQSLNKGLFHSCRIDEVVGAVAAAGRKYPSLPVYVAGFSLGGNFALRVAAHPDSPELRRVLAVCPVLHPPHTMRALEDGLWLYKRYFLQRWRRSLRAKAAAFPGIYRFGDLRRLRTLTQTTEYFVRNYTAFGTLEDYLCGYSVVDGRLDTISTESVIVLSADDPVIPVDDASRLGSNPALHVEVLQYGGHCALLQDYRLR